MQFDNVFPVSRNIGIPASFVGKLAILGTCEFSKSEEQLFQAALICIDKHIQVCPPPVHDFNINVFLVDSNSLKISFEATKSLTVLAYGHYVEMIVYPVGLWRKAHLSDDSIFFAMLEELCHAVWKISDETAVKSRVIELIKYINPDAKVEDLLRKLFVESLLYSAGLSKSHTDPE